MRVLQAPTPLLYLLVILSPHRSRATPLILEESMPQLEDNQILERGCANPCGYYGQVCCAAGQICYTDSSNQAQCSAGSTQAATQQSGASGQWQMFTTTYVATDLVTKVSTYSSFIPASTTANLVQTVTVPAATASSSRSCQYSEGQTPCGSTCCSAGQFCDTETNTCAAVGGGSSGYYSSLFTVTQSAVVPLRPTSGTVVTVTSTSTGSASTTVPFVTPVGTDGSTLIGAQASSGGGGLSGGAIAGIVIGTIAGIIILILLCLCCCAKELLDSLLALFGLGPRRRRRTETTEIYEERHSRHGRSDARGAGRTWFGIGPRRVERQEKRKTGGAFGGLAGVTAGLATLAVVLGLKRRYDRRHEEKSDYSTESTYYSGEYTSASSESSDRRTRDSRRSRSRR